MIVLDTNVLVYAVGRDHPLKLPCLRLIDAIGAGTINATTTVEVLQEVVHARAGVRDRERAVAEGRDYATLLEPLIVLTTDDLQSGLRLFEKVDALDAFDAVLAGAALARDAEALVSADAAFGSVPRLKHVVPGTEQFDALFD